MQPKRCGYATQKNKRCGYDLFCIFLGFWTDFPLIFIFYKIFQGLFFPYA